MIRSMFAASSVRLEALDGVRSFEATVRWFIASDNEAGARNNRGAASCARNDGDADNS